MADNNHRSKNGSSPGTEFLKKRRELLTTIAAGGALGLAGCAEQEGGATPTQDVMGGTATPTPTPTPTETPEEGETPKEGETPTATEEGTETTAQQDTAEESAGPTAKTAFGIQISWENVNMNLFSPTGHVGTYHFRAGVWNTMMAALGLPGAKPPVVPIHLKEPVQATNNGCTLEYNLVEEPGTWWDGTEITMRDYYTKRLLQDYVYEGGPKFTSQEYELVDDRTLRIHRQSPLNPQLAELQAWQDIIWTRRDYWRSWLEKFKDASTKDEVKNIRQDITKLKIGINEFMEKGLGNGIYKPTEVSTTRIVNELHDGHFKSDLTNVDKEIYLILPAKQKRIAATKNGELDVGIAKKHPGYQDYIKPIVTGRNAAGQNLRFNFRNKHLDRRPVRQAFAYLIDREQINTLYATQAGGWRPKKIKYQMGTTPELAKNWAGENGQQFLDSLIRYGSTSKPKKAAQTLRGAGYSRQKGTWVGPDGDPITGLRYVSPPWGTYKKTAKLHSKVFDEFGFGTELLIGSGVNMWKKTGQTHEWELANMFYKNRHPQGALSSAGGNFWDTQAKYGGPVVKNRPAPTGDKCKRNVVQPELVQKREPRFYQPVQMKFPKKVGSNEITGEGQMYNAHIWDQIFTQTQSTDEFHEYARKLMWFLNWSVFEVNYHVELWKWFGNTKKYEYDWDENEITRNRDALRWNRYGKNYNRPEE